MENQLVDVLDSHDPEQYLVRTRPRKDERPKIGWVEACFLEKKSTNIGQVSNQLSQIISLLLTCTVGFAAIVTVAAATDANGDDVSHSFDTLMIKRY